MENPNQDSIVRINEVVTSFIKKIQGMSDLLGPSINFNSKREYIRNENAEKNDIKYIKQKLDSNKVNLSEYYKQNHGGGKDKEIAILSLSHYLVMAIVCAESLFNKDKAESLFAKDELIKLNKIIKGDLGEVTVDDIVKISAVADRYASSRLISIVNKEQVRKNLSKLSDTINLLKKRFADNGSGYLNVSSDSFLAPGNVDSLIDENFINTFVNIFDPSAIDPFITAVIPLLGDSVIGSIDSNKLYNLVANGNGFELIEEQLQLPERTKIDNLKSAKVSIDNKLISVLNINGTFIIDHTISVLNNGITLANSISNIFQQHLAYNTTNYEKYQYARDKITDFVNKETAKKEYANKFYSQYLSRSMDRLIKLDYDPILEQYKYALKNIKKFNRFNLKELINKIEKSDKELDAFSESFEEGCSQIKSSIVKSIIQQFSIYSAFKNMDPKVEFPAKPNVEGYYDTVLKLAEEVFDCFKASIKPVDKNLAITASMLVNILKNKLLDNVLDQQKTKFRDEIQDFKSYINLVKEAIEGAKKSANVSESAILTEENLKSIETNLPEWVKNLDGWKSVVKINAPNNLLITKEQKELIDFISKIQNIATPQQESFFTALNNLFTDGKNKRSKQIFLDSKPGSGKTHSLNALNKQPNFVNNLNKEGVKKLFDLTKAAGVKVLQNGGGKFNFNTDGNIPTLDNLVFKVEEDTNNVFKCSNSIPVNNLKTLPFINYHHFLNLPSLKSVQEFAKKYCKDNKLEALEKTNFLIPIDEIHEIDPAQLQGFKNAIVNSLKQSSKVAFCGSSATETDKYRLYKYSYKKEPELQTTATDKSSLLDYYRDVASVISVQDDPNNNGAKKNPIFNDEGQLFDKIIVNPQLQAIRYNPTTLNQVPKEYQDFIKSLPANNSIQYFVVPNKGNDLSKPDTFFIIKREGETSYFVKCKNSTEFLIQSHTNLSNSAFEIINQQETRQNKIINLLANKSTASGLDVGYNKHPKDKVEVHLGKDFVKKADDVELVAKTIQYLKRDRAINFDKNSLEKYAKIVFEDEKSKALFKEKLKSLNVDLLKKENLVKLCETQEEFNKKLDLISDIIDKRISKYKTTKDKAFSYNCILEIMNYIGDRQSLSKDLNIKNHNIDDNVIALSFIVRDFCKNNKGFISQKSENMPPLLNIIKKYNENDYGVKITVDNNKDEKGLLLHHINEELNKIFKPHQAEKSIDVTGCDINIAFERDEKGFIKFRQQYIIKNEDFSLAYGSEAKTELPLGLLINYNQKDKSIKNIIISGELFGHIEELKSTGSVFDDDSNDKNQIKQQGFKFNPSSSNIKPLVINKDMIQAIQTIKNEIGSKNLGSYEEDTQPTALQTEANAILHLFNKFLESEDNQLIKDFFTNNPLENKQFRSKKPIFGCIENSDSDIKSGNSSTGSSDKKSGQENSEMFLSKQQANQALTDKQKLAIIEKALSQRNKYDEEGSKNPDKNRAKGTQYEALKQTLQTLNSKNINFTTESLKLFNVDNKETLKNDKEKENLIKEKPLFVRAMGSAKMMSFIKIDIKDVPKNNIVITKFTSKKALQANLTFREIKQKNNQQ